MNPPHQSFAKCEIFKWVSVLACPCYMDIMRGFSMVGFPSNFPNVQKFFWKGERLGESELLIYNERTFSCSRLPIKFTKLLKIFLEGVRLRHSVLLVYNERAFSVIVFPSDSPNFRIYFWKGEHFEGSQLLVYNGRTFSPAKTPRQVQWYEVKRVIHENIRRKRHK